MYHTSRLQLLATIVYYKQQWVPTLNNSSWTWSTKYFETFQTNDIMPPIHCGPLWWLQLPSSPLLPQQETHKTTKPPDSPPPGSGPQSPHGVHPPLQPSASSPHRTLPPQSHQGLQPTTNNNHISLVEPHRWAHHTHVLHFPCKKHLQHSLTSATRSFHNPNNSNPVTLDTSFPPPSLTHSLHSCGRFRLSSPPAQL
jgi:hypothetical protein